MKITIEKTPNVTTDIVTVDVEDLGVTESEWEKLSLEERTDKINAYLGELSEQPYWMVDSYTEH